MFNRTKIVLSTATVLSTAVSASAATKPHSTHVHRSAFYNTVTDLSDAGLRTRTLPDYIKDPIMAPGAGPTSVGAVIMPAFSAVERPQGQRNERAIRSDPRGPQQDDASTCKSIGQSASISLLIATYCRPSALRCRALPIADRARRKSRNLEQQLRQVSPGAINGPTAPQSVEAQLHHQPTPEKVQNAEIKAKVAADVALQRARQADTDW